MDDQTQDEQEAKLATPPAPATPSPDPSKPTFKSPSDQQSNTSKVKSTRSMKSLVLFIVVIVAVAALAGIYAVVTQKKSTTKTSTSTPAPAAVSITSSGFVPANITVKIGTQITWKNTDTKPHTIASDPYPNNNGLLGFDSQQALQPRDTYSYTFDKAGTFPYHDDQHPYDIKGTVVVTPIQN